MSIKFLTPYFHGYRHITFPPFYLHPPLPSFLLLFARDKKKQSAFFNTFPLCVRRKRKSFPESSCPFPVGARAPKSSPLGNYRFKHILSAVLLKESSREDQEVNEATVLLFFSSREKKSLYATFCLQK